MALPFTPYVRPGICIYRIVIVPVKEITYRPCLFCGIHINHIWKKELCNCRLSFIRMDKRRVKRMLMLCLRSKKFPDRPMPLYKGDNCRQLISFVKFLNSRLQHPPMSMIIYNNHFSIPVVPKAKHRVDQCLLNYFVRHDYCTRHADMMIWMSSIIQWRKCQRALSALFCSKTSHTLYNLGHHESVKSCVGMLSMILCTSDGDEHNVVFAAFLNLPAPWRGLDV